MSVKFKVGFTIAGETLFAMIAKMLPIENVSVEEVPIKADRIITGIRAHPQIAHKPKPQKQKRASPGPSLTRGINGIIVTELSSGPKREVEMRPKIKAAGFSENSMSSRLEFLRGHGVVERVGDGRWQIKSNAEA